MGGREISEDSIMTVKVTVRTSTKTVTTEDGKNRIEEISQKQN